MRQFRHIPPHAFFGFWLGFLLLVSRAVSFAHDDAHEGLKKLTEAMAASPQDASLIFDRASLYEQHGDFALALADLDQVAKLSPLDQRSIALRARILRLMGKPAEAKELQQAFLQKYPKQDQVRFEYCRTLADLGEQDAALRELDALISAAEHPSPDVVAMRLEITESIKETGPEQALSWLNHFLEKHPLPVFQEAALRLEIKLGKTSDALLRLDFLVASAPRPEAFLLKKAEVLHASGQSMRARTAAVQAQQAISRLPDGARNSRASISLLEKLRVLLPTNSSP